MTQVDIPQRTSTQEPVPIARKRALGPGSSIALVIGNMIGSGIFLLPASLAAFGGISLVGWVFTAAGAMFLALLFARLASIMPKVGGPYAYSRRGFGDFAGFWIAWGYWISVWTGNAAIAVALVSYLQGVIPILGEHLWVSGLVAIGLIWLVTWINVMGIKQAGVFQVVTTIMKLVPLVAMATIGLFWVNWSHFIPFNTSNMSPFAAVTAVAALTLWAFLGVESATIPADEVKDPDKTIPRATVFGTIVTGLVYILSTVAVMGILPLAQLGKSGAPFADAARSVWGQWAYYAVVIGAVISCLGNLNGFTLIQGQVPLAAAQDRLFPAIFGKLSRRGVPWFGVVISSTLVTLLLIFNYSGSNSLVQIFNFIILLATLTTLIPYAFCAMAELMIFIQDREHFHGKRLLGSSIIAGIAFAYSVWAVIGSGAQTVLYGFILLLLGIPAYVWMHKQQSDEEIRRMETASEHGQAF
ncbi:MAG TPA: amino acid permease [Ktedonobacteraceae bacterium]|nr:amino acid permease [Ktedonobacteraceae bacterium]